MSEAACNAAERGGRPVAAVVPCKDESARIAATVAAVASLPDVDLVVVVDDGSSDDTAAQARAAGAEVVAHARNAGKAAALMTGVAHVRALAAERGLPTHDLLFVDGDLEASAANLGVLLVPLRADQADLTIATLPPQKSSGGGRGFVVRLGREGISELTGFAPVQPLSGMRALTDEAFTAAAPLARGWGVEVAMTIDVLTAGLRVLEVPCELHHRVSGSSWRDQLHRAAQYRDVWLALAVRRLRRRFLSRSHQRR